MRFFTRPPPGLGNAMVKASGTHGPSHVYENRHPVSPDCASSRKDSRVPPIHNSATPSGARAANLAGGGVEVLAEQAAQVVRIAQPAGGGDALERQVGGE